MTSQQVRNIVFFIAIGILIFGLGYQSGHARGVKESPSGGAVPSQRVSGTTPPSTVSSVNFSLFWEVWNKLSAKYVDKSTIVPQTMVYGAISGMVSSLGDPYTVFLPPTQNKESKDDLNGKFEGIGAQLGIKNQKIVIIAPLKDSPAQHAGLKAGDWIVKVDGKETLNWTLPEAVSHIRGEKGTSVVLAIVSNGQEKPKDISVVRDTINVASVEEKIVLVSCSADRCIESPSPCAGCNTIAYLKLSRFGDQTDQEWDAAVNAIVTAESSSPHLSGMVLDLRNNPGGYLTGAVYIGSEFLKEGTIVRQQYADGSGQTFSVNRKGHLLDIPLVVLVNKGSASASEIVAGALHDHHRATLVGETTFGKGSIQEVEELAGGAGIHITVAKWLLPSGDWINGKGITPDTHIENDESSPDVDLQLQKAYDVMLHRR